MIPNWYFDIFQRYRSFLQNRSHLYLALSAGVDSNMLLHWLYIFKANLPPITTIHVNHHLHGKFSDIWADFARTQAQTYGFPFIYHDIHLNSKDPRGIEAAGREERYLKMAQSMIADSLLCVAHHRSDQAETLFYRLMRSSGIRGMCAMRDTNTISFEQVNITLFRPFLSLSKHELYRTATALNIPWMEDYTNHETDFTRNQIRNGIFPVVEKFFPQYEEAIYQTSLHLQESYTLLAEMAKEDLTRLTVEKHRLNRLLLLEYSKARQKNVLQHWFNQFDITLTQEQWQEFYRIFIHNTPSHSAEFWLNPYVLRYFQQEFYLLPIHQSTINKNNNRHKSPSFMWEAAANAPPKTFWDAQNLILKPRTAGIRFHPVWRHKSQSLKKLLQERHIPQWERDNIWMLCNRHSGEIYWITYIGLAQSLKDKCQEEGYLPRILMEG